MKNMLRFLASGPKMSMRDIYASQSLINEMVSLGVCHVWGQWNGLTWYTTNQISRDDLIGMGVEVLEGLSSQVRE